ncbi:DNA adenine methylase [Paenibacillus sp. GYB003]|uniref:DNA adenine methylase n=1 Tax=Paenibacillus sp. GYB003 TaxID=2994392 RepID=UPI002F96C227
MKNKNCSFTGMMGKPLSVIPYIGGKHGLVRNIVPIIVWCVQKYNLSGFIEGNAGGARTTLNLDPGLFKHRILNDLDYSLCKMYATIADDELVYELVDRLKRLGYSRESFELARQNRMRDFELCDQGRIEETSDWVTAAAYTYICATQSMSANMKSFKDYYGIKKSMKYFEKVSRLPQFHPILSGIVVTYSDCYDLLSQYRNKPSYFGYFDPPYPPETMRSLNHYSKNMSTEQHEKFRDLLRGSECKLAVSSYGSSIYDELLYDGWYRYLLKMKPVSLGNTGEHAAEFLYCNFKLPRFLERKVTLPISKV